MSFGTFLSVENKKKKDLIELLVRRGYDSDPVKAWKEAQNKGKVGTVIISPEGNIVRKAI